MQEHFIDRLEQEQFTEFLLQEHFTELFLQEHFREILLQKHFTEIFLQEHFREILLREHFTEIFLQEQFREILLQEHFNENMRQEHLTQFYEKQNLRAVESPNQQHITNSNCTHSVRNVSPTKSSRSKRGAFNSRPSDAISMSPLCSNPIIPSYRLVLFTGYPQDSAGVTFNLTNQIKMLYKIKFIDIYEV